MTPRKSFVTCVLLLSFASIIHQVATAQADAISGKWGSDSQTLLDLKFDGKAAVTGTAYFYINDGDGPYTSPIKRGTFNPKNGTLKVEGDFKGPKDALVQYVIDGQVEQDVLKVQFVIGGNKGSLTMNRISQ
jgi:hypothetical protein